MDDDRKSRTQKKNEARALQKLGEQLVALSPEQLAGIELSDELRRAVNEAATITSHGARRRQLQYIGTLMREFDPEPIQDALENIRYGDQQKLLAFKKIEKWRDELKEGNSALIEEILNNCPDAERQRLTQLARNARNEYEAQKGVKSSRILFRYLKQISGL
jgi:ribosome-associated protein